MDEASAAELIDRDIGREVFCREELPVHLSLEKLSNVGFQAIANGTLCKAQGSRSFSLSVSGINLNISFEICFHFRTFNYILMFSLSQLIPLGSGFHNFHNFINCSGVRPV